MRRLVNRYAAWMDKAEDVDAFGGFLRFLSFLGLMFLGGAIVLALIIFVIANLIGSGPSNGCEYGHWSGKVFICDRYYPPPQVRSQ